MHGTLDKAIKVLSIPLLLYAPIAAFFLYYPALSRETSWTIGPIACVLLLASQMFTAVNHIVLLTAISLIVISLSIFMCLKIRYWIAALVLLIYSTAQYALFIKILIATIHS
jgi:hypothetical protein